MTNNPFFSIVIPTYNRAGFIRKAIESVLAQSFQDFEVIVVDDGSTDDTESIVKSIVSQKIVYRKKENAERAAARNFGIMLARGKYITFLDSDDLVYPHHLSTAFDFFLANNSPEIFHLAYQIISTSGIVLKKVDTSKSINETIISGNPLSCNGVFVRQEIMRTNLFNEDRNLSGLEDWELWLRVGAKHKFLSCHTITSAMVQHEERSVMEVSVEKLIKKMERFVFHVFNSQDNRNAYGDKLKKTSASAKTYTALHLALAGAKRQEVWHHIKEGVFENPYEMFRKRFFVILKLILLK